METGMVIQTPGKYFIVISIFFANRNILSTTVDKNMM